MKYLELLTIWQHASRVQAKNACYLIVSNSKQAVLVVGLLFSCQHKMPVATNLATCGSVRQSRKCQYQYFIKISFFIHGVGKLVKQAKRALKSYILSFKWFGRILIRYCWNVLCVINKYVLQVLLHKNKENLYVHIQTHFQQYIHAIHN